MSSSSVDNDTQMEDVPSSDSAKSSSSSSPSGSTAASAHRKLSISYAQISSAAPIDSTTHVGYLRWPEEEDAESQASVHHSQIHQLHQLHQLRHASGPSLPSADGSSNSTASASSTTLPAFRLHPPVLPSSPSPPSSPVSATSASSALSQASLRRPISHRLRSRSLPNIYVQSVSVSSGANKVRKNANLKPAFNLKCLQHTIQRSAANTSKSINRPTSTSASNPQSSTILSIPSMSSYPTPSPSPNTVPQSSGSKSSNISRRRGINSLNASKSNIGGFSPVSSSSSTNHSTKIYLDHLAMAPMQPPPVNSHSLKEIDLQEIFKNPQLRHDIVFDPQLQFRPNLDGERGKRKRLLSERYWDSIVVEVENLGKVSGQAGLPLNSKLPLLFITLREVLLSLLPVKDRSFVDSILDSDLLIQQLKHYALDILGLAQWMASVFKAHCAPMRDPWVDQMVARIQEGVTHKSAKKVVEGLRMVFAILEAMKLDVANHQIRSLRPILIDTAIEFEQDYYIQIIDKGKFTLDDSLVWYKKCVGEYAEKESTEAHSCDNGRSSFVYGILQLLSCTSQTMTEFPSSFGFDFSRLAGFRAELRQIVCAYICVTLYRQMIHQALKDKADLPQAKRLALANQALSTDSINKLKKDILVIISDSSGNSKWTRNTNMIALEIARRVQQAVADDGSASVTPSESSVDMASSWMSKHIQPSSTIYKLIENKISKALFSYVCKSLSVLSSLEAVNPTGQTISMEGEAFVNKEMTVFAERVLVLIRFHWGVFGKFYVATATCSVADGNDNEKVASDNSLRDASADTAKQIDSSLNNVKMDDNSNNNTTILL